MLSHIFFHTGDIMEVPTPIGVKTMFEVDIVPDTPIEDLLEADQKIRDILDNESAMIEQDRDIMGMLKYHLYILDAKIKETCEV